VRKFVLKGTGFRRMTDGEAKEGHDRLNASAQGARLPGAGWALQRNASILTPRRRPRSANKIAAR